MCIDLKREIEIILELTNKFEIILEIILINSKHLKEYNESLDICIIMDNTSVRKRKLIKSIRKALFKKVDNSMNILVYYQKEFIERSKLKCSFEYEIRKSGRIIYKR